MARQAPLKDILKVSGPTPAQDRKTATQAIIDFFTKKRIDHDLKARVVGGVPFEELVMEYGFIRIYASTSIRVYHTDHGWYGPISVKKVLELLQTFY